MSASESTRKIVFFIKIFEKKEYLIDFLNGKLFLNKLSYFRKLEEGFENNRADKKEGLNAIFQSSNVKVELDGYQLKDLVGTVEMRNPSIDDLHVFCLYAGTTNKDNIINKNQIKKNKLDEVKEDLNISDELKNLGEYCVIIHNTSEFINRVVKAITRLNYSGKGGLVKYYDLSEVNSTFHDIEAVFNKQSKYKHQKEYRFAINSYSNKNKPLIINIGNIKDIAFIIKLEELEIEYK